MAHDGAHPEGHQRHRRHRQRRPGADGAGQDRNHHQKPAAEDRGERRAHRRRDAGQRGRGRCAGCDIRPFGHPPFSSTGPKRPSPGPRRPRIEYFPPKWIPDLRPEARENKEIGRVCVAPRRGRFLASAAPGPRSGGHARAPCPREASGLAIRPARRQALPAGQGRRFSRLPGKESMRSHGARTAGPKAAGVVRLLFVPLRAIDARFEWRPSFASGFAGYLTRAPADQPALVGGLIDLRIEVVKVNPIAFACPGPASGRASTAARARGRGGGHPSRRGAPPA